MKIGARKAMSALVSVTLLLAGCGGGADTATTTGPDAGGTTSTSAVVEETTTTVRETTTSATTTAGEQGASIEDIPAECVAEIAAILQVFEPAVEGIDWETATIEDHLQVMMTLASASIADTSGCENV
ncbi:MAG: hypothetical protein ACRDXF_02785 [Acidimicrobiia bacterium]